MKQILIAVDQLANAIMSMRMDDLFRSSINIET